MSKKNVIVFHIGWTKTGTTALQGFLVKNNVQLKQKGWVYPLGKNPQSLLRLWNQNIFGGNGSCLLVQDEKFFNNSFEEILEYVAQYNVIISSENISDLTCERFEKLFRIVIERYDNIKVVVYLRRQDEYIESRYNQIVKSITKENKTLQEYVDKLDFKNPWFDYLSKLEILEKLLGDRLIVRRYSKDTVEDFLSLIGVKLENPEISSNNPVNLSLGSRLLEIKRIMNGFSNLSPYYEDQIAKLNVANFITGRKDSYKVMSPEMRQKILDEYAADNEEIARHYLKDGKPLFEDMNINIPYKEYRATSFEEDMIRVFFTFINDMDTRINDIAINVFKGDRKLAYFGAGGICKDCLKTGLYRPNVIIDDKGGRDIDGIPVVSFDEIENWKDYYVIITTSRYLTINAKRLQNNGLVFLHDYLTFYRLNFFSLDYRYKE